MNNTEKIEFSEAMLTEISKQIRACGVRVHKSSDFSIDGYSAMLSIFIPFSDDYLTNEKIDELKLILEEND